MCLPQKLRNVQNPKTTDEREGTMTSKAFRGEVWTNTHPDIMSQIVRVNAMDVDGKAGHDMFTDSATELMQKNFSERIKVIYTSNGTAANVIALIGMRERNLSD